MWEFHLIARTHRFDIPQDLQNQIQGDNLWLGYYIHRRSAIHKQAQQFGRIKGGRNFQAIYLQYHF